LLETQIGSTAFVEVCKFLFSGSQGFEVEN